MPECLEWDRSTVLISVPSAVGGHIPCTGHPKVEVHVSQF